MAVGAPTEGRHSGPDVSTNAMAIRGGSSHATAALAAYGRRLLRMSAISGTDGELLSSPARRQTALLTALGDARAAGLRWSILRRTAFPKLHLARVRAAVDLLWPSQPADPASIGRDCSGGDGSAMTPERIRPFQSSPLLSYRPQRLATRRRADMCCVSSTHGSSTTAGGMCCCGGWRVESEAVGAACRAGLDMTWARGNARCTGSVDPCGPLS